MLAGSTGAAWPAATFLHPDSAGSGRAVPIRGDKRLQSLWCSRTFSGSSRHRRARGGEAGDAPQVSLLALVKQSGEAQAGSRLQAAACRKQSDAGSVQPCSCPANPMLWAVRITRQWVPMLPRAQSTKAAADTCPGLTWR